MSNEDWDIPSGIRVSVDGKRVTVPQMDALTRESVIRVVDTHDPFGQIMDFTDLTKWAQSLSDDEVDAVYKHFSDHWTWESGNDCDYLVFKIAEKDRARRQAIAQALTDILQKQSVRKAIEKTIRSLDKSEALIGSISELGESVNTPVTPETTDDPNSKPS